MQDAKKSGSIEQKAPSTFGEPVLRKVTFLFLRPSEDQLLKQLRQSIYFLSLIYVNFAAKTVKQLLISLERPKLVLMTNIMITCILLIKSVYDLQVIH